MFPNKVEKQTIRVLWFNFKIIKDHSSLNDVKEEEKEQMEIDKENKEDF